MTFKYVNLQYIRRVNYKCKCKIANNTQKQQHWDFPIK